MMLVREDAICAILRDAPVALRPTLSGMSGCNTWIVQPLSRREPGVKLSRAYWSLYVNFSTNKVYLLSSLEND